MRSGVCSSHSSWRPRLSCSADVEPTRPVRFVQHPTHLQHRAGCQEVEHWAACITVRQQGEGKAAALQAAGGQAGGGKIGGWRQDWRVRQCKGGSTTWWRRVRAGGTPCWLLVATSRSTHVTLSCQLPFSAPPLACSMVLHAWRSSAAQLCASIAPSGSPATPSSNIPLLACSMVLNAWRCSSTTPAHSTNCWDESSVRVSHHTASTPRASCRTEDRSLRASEGRRGRHGNDP